MLSTLFGVALARFSATSAALVRDRADLTDRHGDDVGSVGNGLAVEVATGQHDPVVWEHQWVVRDGIDLLLDGPSGEGK